MLLLACASEDATSAAALTIKGSDSEVNLVQRLAERFLEGHADVTISVTGGGSGTGIAALMDGTADLANSSRDLSGLEKIAARRKGLDVRAFVFATDGLAVIVHADNPVASLSLAELAAVYRGEVTSWQALGAPEALPVSLYGRQSSSGTYDYFRKAAVKGDYASSLKQMNGSAQIAEAVRNDRGGIGYVAAGYVQGESAEGLRVLALENADGQKTSPLDVSAVLSGAYPLSRPLYQFMPGAPDDTLRAFLRFEASDEGQAIVQDMGFFTVAPDDAAANAALLGGA
jgi:phosphate transport system substrate-binding protein